MRPRRGSILRFGERREEEDEFRFELVGRIHRYFARDVWERDLVGLSLWRAGLIRGARIVYVEDEPRRRAFAYGTLPSHAERGEERFAVEWGADDGVAYELRSFSRPRLLAARLAYPVTRALQRRFVEDSLAAMGAAVRGAP